MSEHDDLESAALFIHGMGATVNLIGVLYNFRRRNWLPFWGNLFGFCFHTWSAWLHLEDLRKRRKE